MNVKNCVRCGKIFNYMGKALCPKCIDDDERDFLTVKQYLWDNPGASIADISEATEVDEKKIIIYLREGRLQLTPGQTGIILRCERCETIIYSGRYCDDCVKEISKEFKAGFGGPEEERGYGGKDPRLSQKNQGTIHLKDRFTRQR